MGSGNSPCASCKLLRRRCAKDCIFAPYFPSDDPQKFAIVHKVFGASNVSKMLQEFLCCGRFIFGPDIKSIFLTIFLIVAPVAVFSFCAFVARKLLDDFSHHSGYSIMIIEGILALCLEVFVLQSQIAGFNIVGFGWITSPAATELETIVLNLLAKALKLPHDFHSTASEAVLVVLLAARDKILRTVGKDALPKLVTYASDQTHSSLLKACQIGGLNPELCRSLNLMLQQIMCFLLKYFLKQFQETLLVVLYHFSYVLLLVQLHQLLLILYLNWEKLLIMWQIPHLWLICSRKRMKAYLTRLHLKMPKTLRMELVRKSHLSRLQLRLQLGFNCKI
ncbi:hypothetical protein HN51_045745, partial [Arachis hypogaea]